MSRPSDTNLLALHAVRLRGFVDTEGAADRFQLPVDVVGSRLLDFQAAGWIMRLEFAGDAGWSLTEQGRREDERLLAEELSTRGVRASVEEAYRAFLPLNERLTRACTDWQMKTAPDGRMYDNDHSDTRWDGQVLAELDRLARAVDPVCVGLAGEFERFAGYDARFRSALDKAKAGRHDWVTGTGLESCHRIWFELHEDLISTLGIDRGHESAP